MANTANTSAECHLTIHDQERATKVGYLQFPVINPTLPKPTKRHFVMNMPVFVISQHDHSNFVNASLIAMRIKGASRRSARVDDQPRRRVSRSGKPYSSKNTGPWSNRCVKAITFEIVVFNHGRSVEDPVIRIHIPCPGSSE